jgi:dinuclear metal center YbgI/SA1388 family protein
MSKQTIKDNATVGTIARFLDQFAPPDIAAEWDNVGLLLGDRAASVRRVLTCLTLTPDVATEAIDKKAELIVTHHPILFRPVNRLTADTVDGKMLLGLSRAGIAVYSPHTSFDNTGGGINDALARRAGLSDIKPLRVQPGPRRCKIVVFVPESDLSRVSDALFAAGAGHIGEYRECSFRIAGTGTFFGSDATNPAVGKKGRREEVAEWRLEVVCPETRVAEAVAAMRSAHSYEEPAYDVYPLHPSNSTAGVGRVGVLKEPIRLREFATRIKDALKASTVQVVGDTARTIARVAIVCGAGGEFVRDALAAKADALLTGEARFHECLHARSNDLALVLPGHFASERIGVEELAERMQSAFPALTCSASDAESDPLSSI